MLLFKCASMRIQHITPSLSDVSPSSTFPMHLSQMLISGLASPPHLTGSDPDRQLVGPLHASVGMALVGDAEQDAGKDTQGKNAPGQDVQEKDAQRKTVQEKEIRTYQRIRLETSTSFILGIGSDTSTTSISAVLSIQHTTFILPVFPILFL
jgi:hypothetical protein